MLLLHSLSERLDTFAIMAAAAAGSRRDMLFPSVMNLCAPARPFERPVHALNAEGRYGVDEEEEAEALWKEWRAAVTRDGTVLDGDGYRGLVALRSRLDESISFFTGSSEPPDSFSEEWASDGSYSMAPSFEEACLWYEARQWQSRLKSEAVAARAWALDCFLELIELGVLESWKELRTKALADGTAPDRARPLPYTPRQREYLTAVLLVTASSIDLDGSADHVFAAIADHAPPGKEGSTPSSRSVRRSLEECGLFRKGEGPGKFWPRVVKAAKRVEVLSGTDRRRSAAGDRQQGQTPLLEE